MNCIYMRILQIMLLWLLGFSTSFADVYWRTFGGEIKRANLDGSSVETLFSGAGNVWNMAYMPSTPAATGASVNLLGTAPPVYFSRKLAD